MNVKDYFDRFIVIRERESLSLKIVLDEMNITYPTYKRIKNGERITLSSMRKLKLFVEKWESIIKKE